MMKKNKKEEEEGEEIEGQKAVFIPPETSEGDSLVTQGWHSLM